MGLLRELIDRLAQFQSAAREVGPVIVGEAGTLLTIERQHLGQTPELTGRAKATMYQDMDRLTGIQSQRAVRIVGARPHPGNAQVHVCWRQTARFDLEIGRVNRLTRGAATQQDKKCNERGKLPHDSSCDGWAIYPAKPTYTFCTSSLPSMAARKASTSSRCSGLKLAGSTGFLDL